MKNKFLIFTTIFILVVSGIIYGEQQNEKGGIVGATTEFSENEISVSLEFIPYWILGLDENRNHNLIFSLRGKVDSGNDEFTISPELRLSLFRNVLMLGTYLPLGFEVNETYEETEEVKFIARQGVWMDVGKEWKHFSTNAVVDYEFDYINRPERSVSVLYNAYFHIREEEHIHPYPWTISFGPEFEWNYSFNEKDNYYRDQIFLGLRTEYKGMSQGQDDNFPRSWSPLLAFTFLNKWDQQEYGLWSYEWIWDPSLKFEMGVRPTEQLRLSVFSQIPLRNVEHEIYGGEKARVGLNLRMQLYRNNF